MAIEQENELWPGWKTVRMLGRGSFGAVYEIERSELGMTEKAALKVITIPQNESDIKDLLNDGYDEETVTCTFKNYLTSIVVEYNLMRKLNGCSNIVSCDDYRYVQHDDGIGWDIFIKMELLTPLAEALPKEISEEMALQIGIDICKALVLCAKYDIVHRDIKPQNIFVSPNGDYKLGDFGIAKIVEQTTSGTKAGTPKYMAPEVYGNQPYGASADIYSLGIVLYWLLNERRLPLLSLPPKKILLEEDKEALERRLRGETLPPPKNGSVELKKIVLKACAFRAKDRYHTADEFMAALNSVLKAQDSSLANDPPPDRTKWLRIAAAAAISLAAFSLIFKTVFLSDGSDITEIEHPYTSLATEPNVSIQTESEEILNAAIEETNQSIATEPAPSVEIAQFRKDDATEANTTPQAKTETIMKITNCDSWITLRAMDDAYSEERFKVPLNEKVWYLSDADNGFAKVEYNGIVGYVMSKYIQFDSYSESAEEFDEFFSKTMTIRNCQGSVTLRAEASVTSSELLQVPLGSNVTVISYAQNGLYPVEYKGVCGYILVKYVEY